MNEASVATHLLAISRSTLLDQYWPRMRTAVEKLNDEQVWWRPNDASNSIGNLILHLNGNVRQWLITSFDRGEDHRNRPAEFAERDNLPAAELLSRLGATVAEVGEVLGRLTEADLLAIYSIQGFTVTGVEALFHAIGHFGMHYGQILYITKLVSGEGLGFYRHLDQTGRA